MTPQTDATDADALELIAHLATRLEDHPAEELDAAIGDLIADLGAVTALLARGCTVGQGYLFARPMTEGDLMRWHAARTTS